jgi:hypothetical protein
MKPPNFRPALKGQSQKKVFSKGLDHQSKSIGRQLLEAVLLISLGAGAFAFLSWLPQKLDAMVLVSEAIADLIRGVTQLVEACLGIAAVILIALLLMFALVAFFAGSIRLIKGCISLSQVMSRKRARPIHPQPKRRR